MDEWMVWVGPAGVAMAGIAVVAALTVRARNRSEPESSGRPRRGAVEIICSACGHNLIIAPDQLTPLPAVEVALVARAEPKAASRKLAEYLCPHCESAHCFLVDTKPPTWLGANLYEPQTATAHCQECGVLLKPAPWQAGANQEPLPETSWLEADHGLVCPYCKTRVCVQCARINTRKRTPDGSFMCPRCRRFPVDTLYTGFQGPVPGQ